MVWSLVAVVDGEVLTLASLNRQFVGPLVAIALELAQVRELTGRDEPTVIT